MSLRRASHVRRSRRLPTMPHGQGQAIRIHPQPRRASACSTAVSDRPKSFIGKAEGDPIAGPMFARARLRAVLINTDWISINKEPDADWKDIKPIVEEVLAGLD